jgi:hypothetical protein
MAPLRLLRQSGVPVRPARVTDDQLIAALPGYTHIVAKTVGLDRSWCSRRLARLEDQGVVCRSRVVSETTYADRRWAAPADWWSLWPD